MLRNTLIKKLVHCCLLFPLLSQIGCVAQATVSEYNDVKTLTANKLNHHQVYFKSLTHLPQALKETSGLALINHQLWSINDSGDSPTLYGLSTDLGNIVNTVTLKQAENKDWESLASDENHLYIADCGNNSGARNQFTIYQVPWKSLTQVDKLTADPSLKVVFNYSTKPAILKKYQHNFDCEAITLVNGAMWLFSKNWQNSYTDLYRLAITNQSQSIKSQATYNIKGLITAADYHPDTQKLALLGYSQSRIFGHAFVWFFDVKENEIVTETAKYYQLPIYAQWEGIVWRDANSLILSSEKSPLSDATIAELILK